MTRHDESRTRSDCAKCQALCCVGLGRRAAAGYGHGADKPVGAPCEHLDQRTFRCMIFGARDAHGYTACDGFECHGAGQTVSAVMASRWTTLAAEEARLYFDDLNVLFRMHFLIVSLERGAIKDPELLAGLTAASEGYGGGPDAPSLQTTFAAACAAHAGTVEAILVAAGYAGG